MMSHLIRIVWNRRRSNMLLIVEIFFAFLVLYAVLTAGLYYAEQYGYPLGFSYERVWRVIVTQAQDAPSYRSTTQRNDGTTPQTQSDGLSGTVIRERLLRLRHVVQTFPAVESASLARVTPYSRSSHNSSMEIEGRIVSTMCNIADSVFDETMQIPLVAGRWFGADDDRRHNGTVAVINERLAREIFGTADVVGRTIPPEVEDDDYYRIVGVVSDFRQNGELSVPGNYLFEYISPYDTNTAMSEDIVFRVRSGTPAAFEEQLLEQLYREEPSWLYRIEPMSAMRTTMLEMRIGPLLVAGIVAGFLLLMVALGLVGVIWQNVSRRTRELGLRRAVGATAGDIYRQILGELLVLMSFGALAGVLVVVQVPLFGLIADVPVEVYMAGLVATLLVLACTALLCGLYPGRIAVRIQPTEALHYE